MSKPLWRILFVILGGLALWRVGAVSLDLWSYYRLGPEVPAQVVHWDLIPKGSKYALKASYAYTYGGKKYEAATQFAKPYQFNRQAAEEEIKKMSGFQWTAWVDHDAPQVSSLEKNFPLKESMYAFCLLGIFLYFVYLKFHLELLSRSL